jgi:histidinol-phosphate phosphatase family protein
MVDAIFLDRDGTINVERPDYVKSWSEFAFLSGSLDALTRLAGVGVPIVVVTNQSGIGRGYVPRATVDDIHRQMVERVDAAGGRIDAVYLCPHHPDEGCGCRKPAPGLLEQAAADWGVDLKRCIFVGDSLSDQEAAQRAGCRSLLVASGRQAALLRSLGNQGQAGLLFADLREAADWIVRTAWSSPSAWQEPVAVSPAAIGAAHLSEWLA